MSIRAFVALSEWASQQGGMVTARQAASVGVSQVTLHSLSQAGALTRVRHGVYKLCGVPWNRNDEIRAAWLAAEPGPVAPEARLAVVCRHTAAMVYGFGDLIPPAIQISLPGERRTNRIDLRFHREVIPDDQVEWVDDLRVTTPSRIITDLMTDGYGDLEHLAAIAVDAVTAGKLTGQALVEACGPNAARFGFADGAALAQAIWNGYTDLELCPA